MYVSVAVNFSTAHRKIPKRFRILQWCSSATAFVVTLFHLASDPIDNSLMLVFKITTHGISFLLSERI